MEIDPEADYHCFQEVPAGAIALEAIFDLIADKVLKEQGWVDAHFKNACVGKFYSIDKLVDEENLTPFGFLSEPDGL